MRSECCYIELGRFVSSPFKFWRDYSNFESNPAFMIIHSVQVSNSLSLTRMMMHWTGTTMRSRKLDWNPFGQVRRMHLLFNIYS